jgi:hypothetical protein
MDIIDIVSQLFKASSILQYFRCALTKHHVSDDEIKKLFTSTHGGFRRTKCIRCHSPLLIRRDPADPEGDYFMLMEK